MERAIDNRTGIGGYRVRTRCIAAIGRASGDPTLRCAPRGAKFLHQLCESVRFQINFRKEVSPRLLIPLDVGPPQTGDKSLNMTQWQPKLVRDRG